MKETYYTVYKITNKITGKFYIGTHKTTNLDDNYMGSGKYLKRAIIKDGLDNFTKEILFVYDNPEDMFAKEAEIVNEDFLTEENTYNLRVGGFGGFDFINSHPKYQEWHSIAVSKGGKTRHISDEENSKRISEGLKKAIKDGRFVNPRHSRENCIRFTQTEESKRKRKETMRKNKHSSGQRNSQYGTMWITNGTSNRKIKKDDLIPSGWKKGRIL